MKQNSLMMQRILTSREIADFQQRIILYYKANGRHFSWRETYDPYAILVSEVMLQQTQTERVEKKYSEWLLLFPDISSLAAAPLSSVLSAWNGLGYNRRARFLQDACRVILSNYDGHFPHDVETLETLPGIGPYTARAVSVFSFGTPEIFIETNIRSVFINTFFSNTAESVSDMQILPLVEQTLDRRHPREWYYALMDYGAMLKKNTVNPSRKSAQYTKQSKFSGSLRQARGAILRCLSKQKMMTCAQIAEAEKLDMARVLTAAEGLEKEKLIVRDGLQLRLAD